MININIDCYEVVSPDGGGMRNNHIRYFSTESLAKKFIDEKCQNEECWPFYSIRYTQSFVILESIDEIAESDLIIKKYHALAKLTDEEKTLLGLK